MGMGEYYMPPDIIADMEKASAEQAEQLVRRFVKRATHEYKVRPSRDPSALRLLWKLAKF
jgi:hypothetical protein